MGSRHLIPTTIVSGFPAIGKSFIGRKFPYMARDLESSDYRWDKDIDGKWRIDDNGNKVSNKSWPNNYIRDIKALEHSGMYRVVFVSSHEKIRQMMGEEKIRYSIIYPENTERMKKIILDRCRQRQNTLEFIKNLDSHWDEYIASITNDPYAIAKIMLTPETINEWQSRIFMM